MSEFVGFEQKGQFGLIELRRPKALNALTDKMILDIGRALKQWQDNDDIKAVLIAGEGDRAFCAGGDIREIYKNGESLHSTSIDFFLAEYQVNGDIYHYPKPYVALMHGVTMGGGLGVSVNGHIRVAASNLVLAMPETTIGFFPDTGASHFLSHIPAPGVGNYMGLNSAKLSAAMAKYVGLVDFIVDYDEFDTIKQRLYELDLEQDAAECITRALQAFIIEVELSEEEIAIIEHCKHYDKSSVADIIDDLKSADTPIAHEMLSTLQQKAPTSVLLTHELLQRGKHLNLDQCLAMEAQVAANVLKHQDLYEGIRAAIIDKDQQPHWTPDAIEKVSSSDITAFFES